MLFNDHVVLITPLWTNEMIIYLEIFLISLMKMQSSVYKKC